MLVGITSFSPEGRRINFCALLTKDSCVRWQALCHISLFFFVSTLHYALGHIRLVELYTTHELEMKFTSISFSHRNTKDSENHKSSWLQTLGNQLIHYCSYIRFTKYKHYLLYTVGQVLITQFNYCILSFASEIANLLIAFASPEAPEVRYKQDTIVFPTIPNTIETRNSQLIDSRN